MCNFDQDYNYSSYPDINQSSSLTSSTETAPCDCSIPSGFFSRRVCFGAAIGASTGLLVATIVVLTCTCWPVAATIAAIALGILLGVAIGALIDYLENSNQPDDDLILNDGVEGQIYQHREIESDVTLLQVSASYYKNELDSHLNERPLIEFIQVLKKYPDLDCTEKLEKEKQYKGLKNLLETNPKICDLFIIEQEKITWNNKLDPEIFFTDISTLHAYIKDSGLFLNLEGNLSQNQTKPRVISPIVANINSALDYFEKNRADKDLVEFVLDCSNYKSAGTSSEEKNRIVGRYPGIEKILNETPLPIECRAGKVTLIPRMKWFIEGNGCEIRGKFRLYSEHWLLTGGDLHDISAKFVQLHRFYLNLKENAKK